MPSAGGWGSRLAHWLVPHTICSGVAELLAAVVCTTTHKRPQAHRVEARARLCPLLPPTPPQPMACHTTHTCPAPLPLPPPPCPAPAGWPWRSDPCIGTGRGRGSTLNRTATKLHKKGAGRMAAVSCLCWRHSPASPTSSAGWADWRGCQRAGKKEKKEKKGCQEAGPAPDVQAAGAA